MSEVKTTRKPRSPNRPPLQAEVSAVVVDNIPASAARRTKWTEFLEQAADNHGSWLQVGPFYRDTAMGARTRLRAEEPSADVEVRHIDAETSNVFIRYPAED